MVGIEDLQVRNMSELAQGRVEQPGRNVRAKFGLNKSILDPGWFECRRRTRAVSACAAAMSWQTTASRQRNCTATNVDSRETPIWSARSMSCGRGTPGSPVK